MFITTKSSFCALLAAVLLLPVAAGCKRGEGIEQAVYYWEETLKLPDGVLAQYVKLLDDGMVLADFSGVVVFADYNGGVLNTVKLDIPARNSVCGIDTEAEKGITYVRTSEVLFTIDKDGNYTQEAAKAPPGYENKVGDDDLNALRGMITMLDYGRSEDDLLDVRFLRDGGLICAFRDGRTFDVSEIVRYRADGSDGALHPTPAEKETVTLYALESIYWLSAYVAGFNKSNPRYRVEVKTYLIGDDRESARMRMNTEIIAGDVPSIIAFDSRMPTRNYIRHGLLANLYEIMGNDPDFKMEGYLQNAIAATEHNGALYTVFHSFSIYTFAAKTSDVGEGAGWTLDEFSQFLETKPESRFIVSDFTREEFIVQMSYRLFVDPVTEEIGFDRERFMQLLEIAERFPIEAPDIDYDDSAAVMAFCEGAKTGNPLMLFERVGTFSTIKAEQIWFDEGVTYKGHPGVGGNGAFFRTDARFAIAESAENKDGAWEFIKYMLDNYEDPYGRVFPIRLDDIERLARDAAQLGLDGSENVIEAGDGTFHVIKPSTDLDNAIIMELIETTDRILLDDETIISIISDEVAQYIAGWRTAEQIAESIERKVSVFLAEVS